MGLLLNEMGNVLTKNPEKAMVIDGFFALVFTGKTSLQENQAPETYEKVWNKRRIKLQSTS